MNLEEAAARMFPSSAPAQSATPPGPAADAPSDPAARMFPNSVPTAAATPAPSPQPATLAQPAAHHAAAAEAPPESYTFAVPEDLKGYGFEPDPQLHQEFSTMARQMGLSQGRAQELVNYHLRRLVGIQ